MAQFKLIITHFKILSLVAALNKDKLFPNQEGVYKILSGTYDQETKVYKDLETFGVLTSYSSKKVCRFILALLRHGYLQKVYDEETDDLYLKITIPGIEELAKYNKKRKQPFVKATVNSRKTIVKIDKQ